MLLPRPQRRSHAIVLTSLVDVMFVLLFFFMLAASAVERRAISVGLPALAGGERAPGRELKLDLLGVSAWTLDGQGVTPAELAARLRDAEGSGVRVVPAAGVPVQALTDAMVIVRAADLPLRLGRERGR